MLRHTRNTFQNGWIEIRPSKKHEAVFVYRWRERKPDGGYTKRSEVIGPVSTLKSEANAWRTIEHRKLEVNSENIRGCAVTLNTVINRYLETERRAAPLDRQGISFIPQEAESARWNIIA